MLQRNKSVIGFSFSGLKTAVARLIETEKLVDLGNPQDVSDMAAAFQVACIRHLEQKIILALEQEVVELKKPLTALVVSGGVASNTLFRSR
jgi:N6-L-threonylcarbamoyladenine synthase